MTPELMAQSGKRERILIVDDRADVRRGMIRFLSLHFEVDAAATAEEAEQLLRDNEPSFVLCDYWLGRGQPLGTELLARWRQQYPFLRRTALMTGTKATADMSTPNIDRVFSKPMNLPQVQDWFLDDPGPESG
jgi:DNA-binding NtrC family response regulator